MQSNLKITGETQEVCSDKRKPVEDRKEREEIEKSEEKEDRVAKKCQPWQPAGANFWSKFAIEENIARLRNCPDVTLLIVLEKLKM